MSVTLEKSSFKIYLHGCETPLPILGKWIVEIYLNCTDKRTFAAFHVTNTATSCTLGKSKSELLCVLIPLDPTLKYRLRSLLYEYKDMVEGMTALKNVKRNIQFNHSVQP